MVVLLFFYSLFSPPFSSGTTTPTDSEVEAPGTVVVVLVSPQLSSSSFPFEPFSFALFLPLASASHVQYKKRIRID